MKSNPRFQKIFLAVFLFLSALPVAAQAISLGTLQKNDFATTGKGYTTEFTILFWNVEDSPSLVKLEAKSPEEFAVIIQPSLFLLNQSKIGPPYDDAEYVYLPTGDVKAFPVRVLVKTLDTAEEGEYEIRISARAESFETGIKFVQEKTFRFKLNVTDLPEIQGSQEAPSQGQGNIWDEIRKFNFTGAFALPQVDYRYVFFVMSLLAIISISFLIYKFV